MTRKPIRESEVPYSLSKKDVGEAFRAARKLKGLYDFSYFTKKNIGRRSK
jgi:hypothetical protein